MSLNESIVEDAALEWFGELGYAVGHGPHLAPGEPAAERDSFGDVVLVGRLREAIRRLNPAFPRRRGRRPCARCCGWDAFAHADEPRLSPDAARWRARWSIPGPMAASPAIMCGWWISAPCRQRLAGGEPVHRDRGSAQPAAGHRGVPQRSAAGPDRAEERRRTRTRRSGAPTRNFKPTRRRSPRCCTTTRCWW